MILYFLKKIEIRFKKLKLIHFKLENIEWIKNFSENVTYILLIYLNFICFKTIGITKSK